jgi:hypothetical protein
MIKAIIAHTDEVDEVDLAVISVLAQLEPDRNLLRNSVGLIFCHLESLAPDLLEALAQALPFPTTGIGVPLATSAGVREGFSLLTVAVLTSDDAVFSVGLSEPLTGDDGTEAKRLATDLAASSNQRPRLGLVFGPPNGDRLQADDVVESLSEALPGCPLFGGVAIDFLSSETPAALIHDGRVHLDRYSLTLIHGLIRPRFNLIKIPEKKYLRSRAIISASDGRLVSEINGAPVAEYLGRLGVLQFDRTLPMPVTFMVTGPVGRSRVAVLEAMTPEGLAVFNRLIPTGSTLSLAGYDESDVTHGVRLLTDELKWDRFDFCIIISCLGRNLMLGLDYLAEFDQIRRELGDLLPYVAFYSGGEICPDLEDDEENVNRFHNLVLTCCRF